MGGVALMGNRASRKPGAQGSPRLPGGVLAARRGGDRFSRRCRAGDGPVCRGCLSDVESPSLGELRGRQGCLGLGAASAECRESWPTADATRPTLPCRPRISLGPAGSIRSGASRMSYSWRRRAGVGEPVTHRTLVRRERRRLASRSAGVDDSPCDAVPARGGRLVGLRVGWSALGKADSFRATWGSGETATRH